MGLNVERSKPLLANMCAGIHLAIIEKMKSQLDANKNRIIINGEMAVIVTFANGKGERHEQIYWLGKGAEGKEKYFTKMCIDAGIDMSVTPMDIKKALGSRLWLAIREVYTLENDEVKKDILGNECIEHFIFNTFPIYDVEKPPVLKGNPMLNGGQAMDDFISYRNEGQSGYDVDVIDIDKPTLEVEQIVDEDLSKPVEGVLTAEKAHEFFSSLTPKQIVNLNTTPIPMPVFDAPIVVTKGNPVAGDKPVEVNVVYVDENHKPTPQQPIKSQPNFGDDVAPDANF